MNIGISHYVFLILLLFGFSSCNYDNYSPPKSKLYGKLVYKGKVIRVGSQSVSFNLYQPGFKEKAPIKVAVASDGSYHALLFDGEYQVIFPQGQGPFIQNTEADTLDVNVQGDTKQDIEVKPYYLIDNCNIEIYGRTVSASLSLERVIDNSKLQYVELYIGKTRFTNDAYHVTFITKNGNEINDIKNIDLSTKVPILTPKQNYVFVRIGIKIQGVEDLMFSRVEKLMLK